MALEIGAIIEGKVTGIAKYGAFVSLPEGKSGLVHISEVAASFVNDVHDHVQIGQTVRVKVLSVSQEGKINLSIKRAAEPAAPQPRIAGESRIAPPRPAAAPGSPAPGLVNGPSADQAFEDRLKKFMQESDSRIADNRMYSEHKSRHRRR